MVKRCGYCKQFKSEGMFYKNRSKNDGLSGYCKDCSKATMRIRQLGTKKKAVEYKGGRCEECGYNRCQAALEFHHKDKDTKEYEISDVLSRNWNDIKTELNKCQLL